MIENLNYAVPIRVAVSPQLLNLDIPIEASTSISSVAFPATTVSDIASSTFNEESRNLIVLNNLYIPVRSTLQYRKVSDGVPSIVFTCVPVTEFHKWKRRFIDCDQDPDPKPVWRKKKRNLEAIIQSLPDISMLQLFGLYVSTSHLCWLRQSGCKIAAVLAYDPSQIIDKDSPAHHFEPLM